MQETSTTICLAGVVMYCRISKSWLKLSIAEKSDAASNYRGELLGAVMALLILRAAMENEDPETRAQQVILCDNRGVISHGNASLQSLTEKQMQADLIRLTKLLSRNTKFQPTWEWVEGHAVERKGWSNSTLAERLNHQADILAKEALVSAIAGGSLMEGDFPFKPIRFKLSGARVCSSPRQSLEKDWGYRTARTLCRKGHITKRGLSPCVVGWSR
jgi:ribonuclease HI